MGIDFHYMPENWLAAYKNQRFWLKFRFFFHSCALSAAKNYCFHIIYKLNLFRSSRLSRAYFSSILSSVILFSNSYNFAYTINLKEAYNKLIISPYTPFLNAVL